MVMYVPIQIVTRKSILEGREQWRWMRVTNLGVVGKSAIMRAMMMVMKPSPTFGQKCTLFEMALVKPAKPYHGSG
jgi:hypothetical protein